MHLAKVTNEAQFLQLVKSPFDFSGMKELYEDVAAGDVVIDADARIGYHTYLLAKQVTETGYVVAFESNPYLFMTLCGNMACNYLEQVQPFNRVVAPQSVAYACSLEIEKHRHAVGQNWFDDWADLTPANLLNFKDEKGRIYDKPICSITIDSLNLRDVKLIRATHKVREALFSAKATIERSKPILVVPNTEENKKLLAEMSYVASKTVGEYSVFKFTEQGTNESADFAEVH